MKFKNYIETESGIKDTSTSPGTAGQVYCLLQLPALLG